MAELFKVTVPTINEHIRNIFSTEELEENAVIRKFLITANDGKQYQTNHYNLDMIIALGYRVNSKQATKFRIWATNTLKNHLIKGYTLNQTRLQEKGLNEFEGAIKLIKQTIDSKELENDEAKGLLSIIADYANSWLLLQKYDENQLPKPKAIKAKFTIEYDEAKQHISELKSDLMKKQQASELFAQERDEGLKSILGNIYQTFGGEELYPAIADKASHLLYFIIKDHPFADGNKRTGAFLFILYLAKNN